MKSYILKTDGSKIAYNPRGVLFTLPELQHAVGGYIEVVRLPNNRLMFVNEGGKLKGLPVNMEATKMLPPHMEDVIVGDVLVCFPDQVD